MISSMRAVFAETDLIGLATSGRPKEDIIAGVEKAIASASQSSHARVLHSSNTWSDRSGQLRK